MCFEEIPYADCSSAHIVKNGDAADRKQRRSRKDCRQFSGDYAHPGCVVAIRALMALMQITCHGEFD